ncbi:MAG: outer membrane protein precursor, partial [Myxococcaceae bacterium]|nr:outer membrane protein precursor [Myxococcaceae bacterium]
PVSRPVVSTAEPYQLEAEVQGSADTRVLWSGEGVDGSGLFESASPGSFTVLARTVAEPSAIAAVVFRVVARPRITAFAAEPSAITAGESTQLHWTVEAAREVLLDGEVQTTAGRSVAPAATQTFELAATNEAGLTVTSRLAMAVIPAPAIDTFVAEPPAVTTGQQTLLRWATRDATEVRLDGQPVTTGSLALSPQASQDHLLEARNALGFRVSRAVHLEVAPPPQILSFSADAPHLTSGESTVVRWTTLDATEVLLDGVPVAGTQAVLAPLASGAHVLEARNRLGFPVLATVQLTVVPAPAITAFAADAPILTTGQSTTLRWSTSAASELRLDGVVLTGSSLGVTPAATVDYVLEASNPAGFTVSSTQRVTVVAAPLIQTFAADRLSLTAGESTTLRWTATGATELRLNGALVAGTSQSIAPVATTPFVLVARNAAGASVTLTVQVTVVPAPIILTFTSDAAAVTAGESTPLRWTTTGATELRLDGALVTGSSAVLAPSSTGAHTLTAQNALGFTASQSVNVAVVPAAVIGSFSAARPSITQSESTLITWSVSSAASVRLNGALVVGTSLGVSPSVTTLYTLEARNSLDAAVTASLTLTVVPQIVLGLAASPAAVVVGTPSTLSWTAAGAATLTLNGAPATGTSLAVSPIRSTVYELKATNSLGFETAQSLTLTVSPFPGTIWVAAGQVWLRWMDAGPITGTQTWDVYRSTSPITTLSTATRVGRLLPEDLHAARLKLADPNATWRLPLATGATTPLAPNEAHFSWTPRAAETSFFAVAPTGSSAPQVRFGPIDETLSPVTAHPQRSGVDGASGLAWSDYAIWLDGRAGADPGRADFPVMGPPSFNGLAAIFRVYASVTSGGPMPGLLVLHGN